MTGRIALRLNLGRKLLAVAGMLAALAALIVGLAEAQSEGPLAFEVAFGLGLEAATSPPASARGWT